jgi:hypothetical protein
MAYAPHTNNEVLHELRAGQSPTEHGLILGRFAHAETEHLFEFGERRHPDDSFAPDMPHTIYLSAGETRLGKVLKTVAYIVVDEDENGPVVERWDIKWHRDYDTSWVRA